MKRILMIAATPYYEEKGSSLRIYSILRTLSKEFSIDLVTYSQGQNIDIPNVRVYRTLSFFKPKIGVGKISAQKAILDMLVFIKCVRLIARNQYDIVHAEDFEAALIARVLLLFTNKFFVYDLHNRIIDNITLKKNVSKITKNMILAIEAFVVKRVDLMVLNWNKYSKDELFQGKKAFLYYDQIDLFESQKVSLPITSPYLVYSGNFEPYQGIMSFLEVFRQVDMPYKLVLIGAPSEEVRFYINAENLGKRVILPGRLSTAQTNYLIKNSSAAILPRIEGSTMKTVHYLMLEKAIIAKDTVSNRELLKNHVNALFYSSEAELMNILLNLETALPGLHDGVIKTAQTIVETWRSFSTNYVRLSQA
jgi:glycosyltransferase involved in cell wall biosynthesis